MHCRFWVYLFLVTSTFGSRHLATVLAQSSSSSIVWSSPAPGDRFEPGDTIIGKWQAQPQVVSPSFCLCEGGENGCGARVWPEVKESAGSYLVSVTAPNVTSESAFYLQMKDDFGHDYSSPIFNLTREDARASAHRSSQLIDDSAAAPPDHVTQSQSHQVPLSSSSSSTTADAAPAAAAAAAPAPSTVPSSATTTSEPLVAAVHNAPPAAALAVPLSLAGAIILLAGGLALHHRRQLAAERKRAREKLVRNDDATVAAAIALDLGLAARRIEPEADVEKALYTRAPLSRRGLGFSASASAPPFPDHAPDPYCSYSRRHHEHGQVPPTPPCAHVPACAYREREGIVVPEQRQRTRHFLLPYLPSRLCSRRHPSSSSSSSYHVGDPLFGSTGNGGGGGTSSPWRSSSPSSSRLLISRSRRNVAPPRVAPAWTSPAITESAVTSVTSEVLPSYLPSPNFSSTADRIHSIGSNFEFENVPLSPPLPPPLHTREEAAEPDDLRMKELRGVYEAVARALGSSHSGSG